MVEPNVTTMVITVVDLQCQKCYKKIKKLLCKFPQIRDQVYDEKKNTVTIKVVCCCPEKIKQKICCKGGKSIIGIEIKPKPPPSTETAKPKKSEPTPCYSPVLVPVATFPTGFCCMECSEGRGSGPCYRGYGYPPPQFYEAYCGRPVYDSWAGGYFVCEEKAPACSIM